MTTSICMASGTRRHSSLNPGTWAWCCNPGVDYESLDHAEQEYAVKRLEAALKAFGPGFHIYQYMFKQNRPEIPFAHYDDPVVETVIDQRRKLFESKRDDLYQIEIFYCILLEGH